MKLPLNQPASPSLSTMKIFECAANLDFY